MDTLNTLAAEVRGQGIEVAPELNFSRSYWHRHNDWIFGPDERWHEHFDDEQCFEQAFGLMDELIEAIHSRFRQECLNEHWFLSVADAQEKVEAWRKHYNAERPHSALGNLAPEDFARESAVTTVPLISNRELVCLTT